MGIPSGTYLGGVRDLETLRCRCKMDPIHGCWRWLGKSTQRGPKVHVRMADGSYVLVLGRRAAVYVANGGQRIADGLTCYQAPDCKFSDCVNPEHARTGTQRDAMKSASLRGSFHTPAHRAALGVLQQAARKVTKEQTLEIAMSEDSTAEVVAKYGISAARVRMIRRGDVNRPTQPRSVFEWGG